MTEALDNLGRKINSTNMSIGELKGLIGTLMKSKVGPAKPISNTEKPSEGASGDRQFDYGPLVQAFEKYVKGHSQDISEQANLVEEIKSLLSDIGQKKEGTKGQEKDKGEKSEQKEETFPEKFMASLKNFFKKDFKQGEIVSESTEGLYKVFSKKGSGYTHDVYCERWLHQVYDTLTKIAEKMSVADVVKTSDIVSEIKGDSFFDDAKKASASATERNSSVDFGVPREPRIRSFDESEYQEFMERLDRAEPFEIQISSLEDAKDFFLSLRSGKAFKGLVGAADLTDKQIKSWAGSYSTNVDDIVKYFRKEIGGLSFEDAYQNNEKFRAAYARSGRKFDDDSLKTDQEKKGVMESIIQLEARRLKASGRQERRREDIEQRNRDLQIRTISALEKFTLGFEVLNTAIEGLIDKERKFVQDIRAAAYETAGVTGETRSLQKSYEDIGKSSIRTGVAREKFQEAFLRGTKSGLRDQKKLNSLVSAQLNTEKQIGVEAGSLGEQFLEFGNSFKFNEDQIAAVGRGIRNVGRDSGVVGDRLKQAVDSSKQFVDQMRKASTATAGSVSNVIGLQAEFQKVGVEGGKLLGALSSTSGFLEADTQTLALVANAAARAGLTQEMWNGEILKSNKNIKQFNSGLMQQARALGLAGSNAEEMRASLENMSALDKRLLNMRFKAAFGMESGELVGAIEALENKSRTLAERLTELNKEKAKNLTLEEKAKIAEDERRLKLTAALAPLTAISEAAKGTKSMDEALAKFGKRRGEFEEDIAAIGQAWTSERDVARSSLKTAVNTLNEGLKKAGKKELSIDSKKIEDALKDETKFRELTSELSKAEQELSTAQKAQLDPLSSMNQTLLQMNDTLRDISKSLISGLFSSFIGKELLYLVGTISGVASSFSQGKEFVKDTAAFLNTFFRYKDPSGQDTMQDPRGFITKAFADLRDFIFGPKVAADLGGTIKVDEASKAATTVTSKAEETAAKVVGSKRPDTVKEVASSWQDQLLSVNNSMLDTLKRIADCVCSGAKQTVEQTKEKAMPSIQEGLTPITVQEGKIVPPEASAPAQVVEQTAGKAAKRAKLSPEEIAARKASGQAAKQKAETMGVSPAVWRQAKKQEIKNIKQQQGLNKIEKKELISEVSNGKRTKNIIKLEQSYIDSREKRISQVEVPKVAGIDLNDLISSGKEMAKTAAGILVLAAGAVALASAIVFLSGKIMDAFNLDATKIIQTAGTVGALAAAGAAIAAAGYGAYKLLTSEQEIVKFPKISEIFSEDLASTVAALLILGPALVLLGATIVKLAQMIVGAFGLDLSTVAETAGTVAAIVAAAGALTLAASEALEGFKKLSDNDLLKDPNKIKDLMWKGAKALLILGPGLVLLGATIVKISQIILGIMGLDASTIGAVTGKVAALIAGTAAIAGAVIGAMAGLYGLGLLDDYASKFVPEIIKGGMALMILAPVIVFLAAALNKLISGILGIMGVDAGKAAKVAYDVAALIASTALISVAIIGALAGLTGLGLLLPTAWAYVGPMAAGAAALFILTPAIVVLASALVNMMKGILATREMDASTAAKTAYQVAGIIAAAGAIAVSVMAAMAGLAGLGYLAAATTAAIPAMIGGAIALYALTPVVLSLASSIIEMAGSIAGSLLSSDEIKKVVEGVSSILGGAAKIALSILASVAGLSILGLFFASAMLAIPLMWLGTRAFNALINPIVGFIGAVKEASNKIGTTINPAEAESMSKGIATILQSVGDITKNVASASTSLASMPVYGGFWNWLIGSKISDRMWDGVRALKDLMAPIIAYVSAVKLFSGVVGRIVDPREAKPMGEGVSSILQSCASITDSIFKSAEPLKKMSKYQGFFNWLRGKTVGDMVDSGVDALKNLSGPITRYVAAIKAFSSKVGGTLSPRMAAEMAVGVEDILCAVGGVSRIILKNKENLSGIKYKEWGWFGTNYVKQMNSGAVALEKMSEPVLSYVAVIKRFSKRLGRRLNPRLAASMANGVAEIISGTGEVTKKVLETREELSKIKTSTGWGWFRKDYVKKSREGVKALKELSGPIIEYVDTIKGFSSEVGRKLDVRQAASMARGVAEILGASGDVTEKIVATKDKLVKVKTSEGFWLWATNIPDAMNKGVKALGELKLPIINYVSSITDFSKEVGSKVKPQEAKAAVKGLQQVAGVVEVFSCVLNHLKDRINPLTKSGWFVDSPIEQMVKAKKEMDKFFPVLAQFINSMIQNVSSSFKNVGELKATVKNLSSISQIFQKVGETVAVIREKIVPITKSGWFSGSDVEAIKGAIPKFNGFFVSISKFITDGIVGPISNIDDGSKLKESAKKLVGVSQLLKETSSSMSSLQSMIGLTTDGFFSSSPMKTISANKDKFTQYFAGVSGFINSGILEPIKKITNAEGLVEAGAKLKDIGCFIYGIKLILDNLSGVFSLMESKSIFEKAPLEKIRINKDQFSKYLETAKDFVLSGLLKPSLELPSEEITVGANNLKQTAYLLAGVPVVIKGLVGAVSLAVDKDDFFGETPMKKIADSKGAFSAYFKEIAAFVRDGIALPVKKELDGIDLAGSSKTMSAMSNIVASVVPIIKNLTGVMGMMSGETVDKLDTDFPIDKILSYKNLFADYFKKIAVFLRDGIVIPVKEVFPDTKGIRQASSTLSAMNNIVSSVPRVILGMSKGFVPLVESGQDLSKEVPMEAIINSKEKFAKWFFEIAHFLKDGVVNPINNVIGDPKEIRKAGSTLSAMSNVVGSMSSIIKNLAQMFVGLNERECLREAPAELIASQIEKFSGWFYSIISFLKVGIINPVNALVPDAKEMDGVRVKLRVLTASMSAIPEMFDELGGSISLFSKGFLWRIINGFKISKLSKNFISMANIINEGIVKPIQKFLPSSDELSEVNDQLTEFIMIIEKVASTMGLAGRAFLGIKPMDLDGIVSMKEGVQKVSDPKVFEAEVQKAIRGRSEMAINMAEKQAEAAAIVALSKKTGRTDLSGVEVDTQVDMEKKVVKAVARWSKENHDDALEVRAVNEGINAGAGGPGRSALPAAATPKKGQITPQPKTAEASEALKGASKKKEPIRVEAVERYEFNDAEERNDAIESATMLAKAEILKAIKGVSGENYSIGPEVLSGVKYKSKAQWMKDHGEAKVEAEYIPKFAEGGVVSKATLGVIGEAGPEAVVPLSGIEKYSSGIISGLYEINSTLKKILSQITKSGKKAFTSSISRGEAGSFDEGDAPVTNTFLDIGKGALSVGLGVALAPAISKMLESFKKSMADIVKVVSGSSKNNTPAKGAAASEGSGILGTLYSIGEGLFSMIPSFESNPADCCGAVAESADGLFGSLKNNLPRSIVDKSTSAFEGVKSRSGKAFSEMSSYFSSSFAPLTKGFTRSMNAGEGIFTSLSRGIQSQYMSITKGKSVSEMAQGAFEQIKSSGVKAFNYINSNIPQSWKENASKAFSTINNKIPQSVKDTSAEAFKVIKEKGSKAISSVGGYLSSSFAPLTKGFTRSMEAGEGIFKSLSRGITSQYMSITKGKPVSEVISNSFSQIKDNGIKAFETIKSKIPQSWKDNAGKAFSSVKDGGIKAFNYISNKIPQSVKDNAAKAFGTIKDVGGKALSSAGSYLSSSFAPLTKGFTRSMESGAGVFQSVSRGITSQYMSITKGKPISEIAKGAFDQIKDGGSKAFSYISNNVPQSLKDNAAKAFNVVGGYASKAFSGMSGFFSSSFAPLTKGFTRSMEAGEGVFKSLSRGMTSQFMSLTKGKSISEIAGNAFSSIKEYGKKGMTLAGGALKGLKEKAQGGISSAGGAVKSLFSKKAGPEGAVASVGAPTAAVAPVENVKKIGEAGESVKGNFEGVKEALKNLAEGLKSFANKESFLGALNLIPTGIGLTAMIPGFLGAKLIEKTDGKKIAASLGGLAEGLKSMASGKVLLGAGAILLSSIGLLGLLPALPGLAILGAMSGLVTSGLTALSTGLTSFGSAAANPMMWLGILAIAGLGAALIPLGYALSTLSPLVAAFGGVISTVLGGISGIITAVADGMVNFLGAVSLEKAAGLVGIAGGLVVLSGAIIAFSAATAAAGWISFFGGNSSTLDNIVRLADAGPNLNTFAQALTTITGALSAFEESLANIDGIESGLNRLIEVAINLGSVAPMLEILSSLPAIGQVATPTATVESAAIPAIGQVATPIATVESAAIQETQTRQMTPTNFKSQFTDEWSEKYHPAPGPGTVSATSEIESSLAQKKETGLSVTSPTAAVESSLVQSKQTDATSVSPVQNTEKAVLASAGKAEGKEKGVFDIGSMGNTINSGLKAVFVDLPVMIGGLLISGLKAVFVDLPVMIGGLLISGLKAVFVDLPNLVLSGLGSLGSIILSGLKMVFMGIPKMIGKFVLGGLKFVLSDLPQMIMSGLGSLASLALAGLQAVFVKLPTMLLSALGSLGSVVLNGIKAVFVTLPSLLGGLIISGMKAIFFDLPVWLGKTIFDGITSLLSAIPGAMYNALYAAASAVNAGWIVEGLFGGGTKKSATSKESTTNVETPTAKAESSLAANVEAPTNKVESSLSDVAVQETRKMTPTNFKSQFTDEWSEKYHPAPTENLSGKLSSPESIRHIDEVVSGRNLSYGSIKESHIGNAMPGTSLEAAIPSQVESVGGKPSTTVPVAVSTASPTAANRANIEQKLMKDKASLSPAKSEVVSPELGALTTETEEQTVVLNQMKELFEQFLEMLKPKSQASTGEGGEPGSTVPKNVVGKPTNYYRRVSGNVGQGPGKATVNLGAKAVS